MTHVQIGGMWFPVADEVESPLCGRCGHARGHHDGPNEMCVHGNVPSTSPVPGDDWCPCPAYEALDPADDPFAPWRSYDPWNT